LEAETRAILAFGGPMLSWKLYLAARH